MKQLPLATRLYISKETRPAWFLCHAWKQILSTFPGLVDGKKEVNGADLVEAVSIWAAEIDENLKEIYKEEP